MSKNEIFITHPQPKQDLKPPVDNEAKFVQFLRQVQIFVQSEKSPRGSYYHSNMRELRKMYQEWDKNLT